ncbi:MAG TPA: serine hydrolase domain-containing protein [Gammaproteobacteria bacterium]|nr:serine hydrolase domain-containing protein [Gammaproteobacteria bacterium]
MSAALRTTLDSILRYTTNNAGGAPGVVAMATDREGNFYEGAAGRRQLGQDAPMTTDSVMLLASCTKAVTGVAVMQLVEEGLVGLDDPARKYVPEIGECRVLTGFDAAGQPLLRAPKREITLRHLMLHTAGLVYEFFSADEARYRAAAGVPSIFASCFDAIKSVMIFDPGEAWAYGPNIDWLGKIVEALRGKPLGAVFRECLFEPLGMQDIGFEMSPAMRARLAVVHQRAPDGGLTPPPELVLPQPPLMDMGGHGLYATIGEYMKFIRMILNDGDGPHGRVLEARTVAAMVQNGLGDLTCSAWESAMPPLANSGDFFPGLPKSWAYTFQRIEEDAPTGRPAGSLHWAGIANCYYWIDRKNGIGGMWGSQVLPFMDIGSYPGFVEFESAVYRARRR